MWVYLNNAFLSIVEDKDDPQFLMVRARLRGDLQRAFTHTGLKVSETPLADYRFRARIERSRVTDVMAAAVRNIDYVNFKNSVPDKSRHDLYLRVWGEMSHAQEMRRIDEQAQPSRTQARLGRALEAAGVNRRGKTAARPRSSHR